MDNGAAQPFGVGIPQFGEGVRTFGVSVLLLGVGVRPFKMDVQPFEVGVRPLGADLYNMRTMPYDTHGGGHRGESHLYCPRTEVKFFEMTSEAQRHKSPRKISLSSEDNIRAQC